MQLADGIGHDNAREALLPYYITFLKDTESEVRTAAIGRLAEFSKILDAETLITKVIPSMKLLVNDSFDYVRSALAENMLSICPIIDKGPTNEHILPDFLTMLRDESS